VRLFIHSYKSSIQHCITSPILPLDLDRRPEARLARTHQKVALVATGTIHSTQFLEYFIEFSRVDDFWPGKVDPPPPFLLKHTIMFQSVLFRPGRRPYGTYMALAVRRKTTPASDVR
jgi:hypothetical protein